MDFTIEQWEAEEKARAYRKAQENGATCAQSTSGMIGRKEEYRPTLRDRLKRQIESVTQEQQLAVKASELFDLLCKNPEVARILELMEDLHV